jgi:cytochrome c oxidase assembly protein subunit 15
MGVGTAQPRLAPATPPRGPLAWTTSAVALRRLAIASVAVNVLIVVTGGAVRLTDSGLGCPTWPRCSGSSLVPTDQITGHKVIEFANRSLTFLVAAVLLLTLVAAWRQRRERGLALLALAGIPMQAVLGGIVVLTDLNPWLVAAHFLLSAAIIAVTFLFWWRVGEHRPLSVPAGARALAAVTAVTAALVLAVGTVVTGSGPHAGDLHKGTLHRIHLSVAGVSQLHADLVMVLIGATVGLIALAHTVAAAEPLRRAAWILLGIELAQGVVGYTQYFLNVPRGLVAVHMLGACLVWLAALNVLVRVEPALSSRGSAPVTAAG